MEVSTHRGTEEEGFAKETWCRPLAEGAGPRARCGICVMHCIVCVPGGRDDPQSGPLSFFSLSLSHSLPPLCPLSFLTHGHTHTHTHTYVYAYTDTHGHRQTHTYAYAHTHIHVQDGNV
jgi:hypothetical protein